MAKILKEIGTVNMTIEFLEKLEEILDKQIEKEKKKLESWKGEDFVFFSKEFKG